MSAATSGTDFGGKLKQAREQRGISLRQIASSTKISVVALEALERNEISKLPGGIFSRAFVRSYADEIGLDPEETVKDFLAAFPDDTVRIGSPQAVQQHKDTEESAFESRQHMARTLFKLVLVSLPLGALLLYVSTRGGPPARPPAGPTARAAQTARPATPAERAPVVPTVEGTAPETETSASARGSGAAPAGGGEVAAAPTAGPVAGAPAAAETGAAESGLRLEIAPTGVCWVSLTVDGTLVLARVMQPGERIARRIRTDAVIQVGDAGAFAYTLNGRPGRPLGDTGQVRTLRITPDDYQALLLR